MATTTTSNSSSAAAWRLAATLWIAIALGVPAPSNAYIGGGPPSDRLKIDAMNKIYHPRTLPLTPPPVEEEEGPLPILPQPAADADEATAPPPTTTAAMTNAAATAGERAATSRKKWGVDDTECYWFDNRIHTLGNRGLFGAFHAALAPLSTKIIDMAAYNGIDIRKDVAEELSTFVGNTRARVVDLCCGVGISTRALRKAFPDSETVVGLDTSTEMLSMAKYVQDHLAHVKPWYFDWSWKAQSLTKLNAAARVKQTCDKAATFVLGNAEDTQLPSGSFDLATIMYAFHEVPKNGRDRMLEEVRRLLRPGGTLAVVDISSDYSPPPSMLMGEPFVKEYQENIHAQLASFKGFRPVSYKTLVKGHAGMWLLRREPNPNPAATAFAAA